MQVERRTYDLLDRRARRRGGRRQRDDGKPWYMRRRLWLAVASLAFVGWRRFAQVTGRGQRRHAA
jgi:hypothetical protein